MARTDIIFIDTTRGGNGDIWMRLVSFYALAALCPQYKFYLNIPPFFLALATHTFGDRLHFNVLPAGKHQPLMYTALGIRHLIKQILGGKRFIAPYQRSVIRDKKKKEAKDLLNIGLFTMLDKLGIVQIPSWKWITVYQGYLDVIGIKKLRHISYQQFIGQLTSDYVLFFQRLNRDIPTSSELVIPADLHEHIIVFPTGTSRQFVPAWWASKYLPHAYYAFFFKDEEAKAFINAGLKVVYFYKEPGDIIQLSHSAHWTISTDSFPSHLLQYATSNSTITITEVLASRIIAPVYKGAVVNAVAPCHPCLHLERKNHPLCAAGFSECINWKSAGYTQNILASILPVQNKCTI